MTEERIRKDLEEYIKELKGRAIQLRNIGKFTINGKPPIDRRTRLQRNVDIAKASIYEGEVKRLKAILEG